MTERHTPVVVGIGSRQVGSGQDPALLVKDVAQRTGADLAFGQILGKAVERDVGRGDATHLPGGAELSCHGEADQPQGREHVRIGDQDGTRLAGASVPASRPRIVGRVEREAADLLFAGIEEFIAVEGGRFPGALLRPLDPAIGVDRAIGRQLALDLDGGIDAAGLAE